MSFWPLVAEGLAIVSAALLIIPAVGLSRHLRAIKASQDQFARSATELWRAIGKQAEPTLENARIPAWSRRDEAMLVLGILAFALSSTIKLAVMLNVDTTVAVSASTRARAAAQETGGQISPGEDRPSGTRGPCVET